MAKSILVAYATRYGSTTGVAEAVGAELGARGLSATVKPARDVTSLDGVDAVVLGAPLYIGSMPKDARSFLARHRAALERLPVAVFVLGPLSDKPEDFKNVGDQLDKVLEKEAWLKPASTTVFAGAYDASKLHFPDTLMNWMPANPLKDTPAMDLRDWAAIAAWADTLPEALGLG
jgi:menaquinone-dependent protoporphyrinogen oxidase